MLHYCPYVRQFKTAVSRHYEELDETAPAANEVLVAIDDLEQSLMSNHILPSDFALLVGTKRTVVRNSPRAP